MLFQPPFPFWPVGHSPVMARPNIIPELYLVLYTSIPTVWTLNVPIFDNSFLVFLTCSYWSTQFSLHLFYLSPLITFSHLSHHPHIHYEGFFSRGSPSLFPQIPDSIIPPFSTFPPFIPSLHLLTSCDAVNVSNPQTVQKIKQHSNSDTARWTNFKQKKAQFTFFGAVLNIQV